MGVASCAGETKTVGLFVGGLEIAVWIAARRLILYFMPAATRRASGVSGNVNWPTENIGMVEDIGDLCIPVSTWPSLGWVIRQTGRGAIRRIGRGGVVKLDDALINRVL